MFLYALIPTLVTAAVAAPGNPDNWCRNGAFPSEGPDFRLGRAQANTHFIKDWDRCPDEGKCEDKAYVIAGDDLLVARRYKGWICSAFMAQGKSGKVSYTVGWLPADKIEARDGGPSPGKDQWSGNWTDGYQSLVIKDAGKGELHVEGAAQWDGGHGNVHDGSVDGRGKPSGNKLTIKEEDGTCQVDLQLVGKYLVATDNSECGGMNVRFDSVYLKR